MEEAKRSLLDAATQQEAWVAERAELSAQLISLRETAEGWNEEHSRLSAVQTELEEARKKVGRLDLYRQNQKKGNI